MSASPINGAVQTPIVSAVVARAAAKRSEGEPPRSSFGRLAEDPGALQDFLQQNPEMAVRLKAQVDIAHEAPEAARTIQDTLGLADTGMKNLCHACRFPDPAEQHILRMPEPRGEASAGHINESGS